MRSPRFSPPATGPSAAAGIEGLPDLFRGRRAVVLTGAGCSTESGIPDYRGPDGRARTRAPIQYGEFLRSPEARRRYWARSAVGWLRISEARPNPAHDALARLEEAGAVCGIITQNVDGLHQAAGSRRVVELHGSLAFVRCLGCGARRRRAAFQARLLEDNPGWRERLHHPAESAPDGDAKLAPDESAGFRVPACDACGGIVKPDVVFFGETVHPARVADAWAVFQEAGVLLVAGSSLSVYSGRRFVHRAEKEGLPIVIINRGVTRADDVAAARVEARLGWALPRLASALAKRADAAVGPNP